MAPSPVPLSPRPNPPGQKVPPNAAKTKALAILNSSNRAVRSSAAAPAVSITSDAADSSLDMAEQMNNEVKDRFVWGKRLGEGTYAHVYQAHYRNNPTKLVAIKKIKIVDEFIDGIALDPIREIKYLSELSHPNIIQLVAVFSNKDQNLHLVLEFAPLGDIEGLWKSRPSLPYGGADIKAWALMICQGIWFCHENFILHRDIKGNNLLIAADGTVKIADFGLARSFADPGGKAMTNQVITRYYRPPELFYGAYHYGSTVDMWSIGCVIAELCLRGYFLPGQTDIQQLALICDHFGTPTEETWPGVTSLRHYIPPEKQTGATKGITASSRGKPHSWWRTTFALLGEDGIDLLKGMLAPDPNQRLSSRAALEHRYWTSNPRPTRKENLPKLGGGKEKMAEDLKRKPGETPANGRADKVARKLDFGNMG
ncbi:Pkinase-domain-containing protein [Setomelanomma holmii]|uniref:Pkinase-domain-containing protein n=1 Tax=Setomelanomma holmii TaxID=210430 RepID=A0A9P4HCM2_9PLEO|nr:Pkinase-domain-containing protein [Setomelanomma holmii]